jgi:hypothetical protein
MSEGGWSFHSKKDPRWNAWGSSDIVSSFDMANEAKEKLEELKEEFGEQPDDLKYHFMKY